MKIVRKSKKEQRLDVELGSIIDEFGRAMWTAHRKYVIEQSSTIYHFTPAMDRAWWKYIAFCMRNPNEES